MKNTKSYSQIIQDLSEEIGISIEDTKSLADAALLSVDIKKIKGKISNKVIGAFKAVKKYGNKRLEFEFLKKDNLIM